MIQETTPFRALGFQSFENGPSIAPIESAVGSWQFMTLKIERFRARVRLSGELRSEHLDQVKTELQKCGASAVLDLEEVNLADVEAVRFLNACETKGISVSHCSPYISEWMLRERSRPEARARKRKKRRGDSEGEHGELR